MRLRKSILAAAFVAVVANVGRAQAATAGAALVESTDWTLADVAEGTFRVWREVASRAQRLEAQLRAVEQISRLGGKVDFASWGPTWLSPFTSRVAFLGDLVSVQLPAHRADKAVLALQECPSLKRATLAYSVGNAIYGGFSTTVVRYFNIDGERVDPPSEKDRCRRFIDKLPGVTVEITENGVPVSFEEAFIGSYTYTAR